eukprot:scaffold4771_cov129-Isochrysis_galbana.AAC.8
MLAYINTSSLLQPAHDHCTLSQHSSLSNAHEYTPHIRSRTRTAERARAHELLRAGALCAVALPACTVCTLTSAHTKKTQVCLLGLAVWVVGTAPSHSLALGDDAQGLFAARFSLRGQLAPARPCSHTGRRSRRKRMAAKGATGGGGDGGRRGK